MPAKKTSKTASKKTANTKKVAQKKVTTKKTTLNKSKSKTPVKKTATAKSPQKKASPRKLKASVNYEESQFLASIKPYALKKNEKYMNAKQKQHFQDILESWRHQLQIEQDRTADKIQKNVSHFPDESDRATHEEEFTLELRTRERERRLLSKIKESVEDLKADDYGFCASCGIEIGIRRLEARPTATRCIDCKTIEEIHERQQYG
tara:strand:- start:4397 stop:5014 length:618 start_codon:yes stop_codon:yes gene_type:complete